MQRRSNKERLAAKRKDLSLEVARLEMDAMEERNRKGNMVFRRGSLIWFHIKTYDPIIMIYDPIDYRIVIYDHVLSYDTR